MIKPMTIQQLLQQQFDEYTCAQKLDRQRLKVCGHLMDRHTPALGGIQYQCDHYDTQVALYHSCRDRHCPQCQLHASHRWSERQQQDILPVAYYHLIFTLPHDLNGWVQLAEVAEKQQRGEPPAYPCPKCKKGHLVAIYEINPVWPFHVMEPG